MDISIIINNSKKSLGIVCKKANLPYRNEVL